MVMAVIQKARKKEKAKRKNNYGFQNTHSLYFLFIYSIVTTVLYFYIHQNLFSFKTRFDIL